MEIDEIKFISRVFFKPFMQVFDYFELNCQKTFYVDAAIP